MSLATIDPLRQALAAIDTVEDAKDVADKAEALRRYAKRARVGLESQNACAEIKVRAERRAGELLDGRVQAHRPAKLSPDTTLPESISRDESSRWQQLAHIPEDVLVEFVARIRADGDELTTAGLLRFAKYGSAGLYSSETPEWYTPSEVIERVVAVLGAIDLDPCSNTGEPRIPATAHYTVAEDGLAQEWHGRVYMNPPYGREIGAWVDKLADEFEAGRTTEAIALVPARTDTSWWAHLPASVVCFVTGRLSFSDRAPAPFPSAAAYLGPNDRRFAEEFLTLGLVYVRLEVAA